jgi:hypothetical protein
MANRIGKLILANTSPHFPPPDMWDQRMGAVRDGGMMAICDAVLDRFFSPTLHQSQPGTVSDFRNVLEQTNPDGYLGCCGMLRESGCLSRAWQGQRADAGDLGPSRPVHPAGARREDCRWQSRCKPT